MQTESMPSISVEIQTDTLDNNSYIKEIEFLQKKIQIQKNQTMTVELAVKKQISAFMNFVQEEKRKDSQMREKYLQLTKINKELKKRLDSEKLKATFAECLDCQMLKQDLIRIKEEADQMHVKNLE